ncbi:amidohydrolase family protein [Cellulophaga sp. Hel_I_12]|uniref:amidohydrolase family protein n=1 Tax=Cellulophaga sp. Hel_I_12 TaxID=1249972 RepID=UPI000648A47B|nr:amidohydrolase family protein [Cellulophaga sp. Hel_I_12]
MKLKNYILPILAYLVLTGCKNQQPNSYDLVIQNGQTIDLETGQIQSQDLYISASKIVKIEPSGSTETFNSKKIIDASGTFILPGFWDNHTHFRGGDSLILENKKLLPLFLANGITTVRDAGGDLTSSVMQWKKEIVAGTLHGPTIYTSGPKIDGPNGTWAGSLEVTTEEDIAKALDSLEILQTDFVKLYDSRISGEAYLTTLKETDKRGLISSGHMPFTVSLKETVDAGIDGIEHLYYVMKGCSSAEIEVTQRLKNKEIGFWQAMPLLREGYDESTAQTTFALLKDKNVYVVPTLHIGKTLSYLDEIDHTDDLYLKYMGKGLIKTYQGRINGALNASEKTRKDRKELDQFFGSLTKSLNDAGVQLLAGSDSGAYNSYTYPGISLHHELEAMVQTGMTPLQVLKTSAYNGAHFLKKEKSYGTIAIGKHADLVLLDANPLSDIKNTQKINTVIQNNKVYNKTALEAMLQALLE